MRKLLPKFWMWAGGAAGLLLAAGCSYSHGPEPGPCPSATAAASTYAAAVSPLFDAHCRQCHGSATYQTRGGGRDFSSYAGIKQESTSLLLGCVRHDPGFDPMPKGGAPLSPCDIASLQAWVDAGQPNN